MNDEKNCGFRNVERGLKREHHKDTEKKEVRE